MAKVTKAALHETIEIKNRNIEKLERALENTRHECADMQRTVMRRDEQLAKLENKVEHLVRLLERKEIVEVILVDTIKQDGGVKQVGDV